MRALIATIPPGRGGVPAMLRTALALLAERGIEAEVAWYEPFGMTPRLSVPSYRLGTRRPRVERRELAGAAAGHAIGAWLPELEFTHYAPTRLWRERIAASDLHLVVSGTALAGRAFAATGTPFLAWLASDWHGDRKDRVARFPFGRRLLDRTLVAPVCRRLERRILGRGRILALSEATRRQLDRVAGGSVVAALLPAPIDVELFRPAPVRILPGRVGLAGRSDDPRKNVGLFLAALARARETSPSITGLLIGAPPSVELERAIARRGLDGAVEIAGELDRAAYAATLATLDLLAVTSHQEGFHIAALEALATGCPVVSTRCGGPEELVIDGETGFLTGFDAGEIAGRLVQLASDRELRHQLGAAGRALAERKYGWQRVREIFGAELEAHLAGRPGSGARTVA